MHRGTFQILPTKCPILSKIYATSFSIFFSVMVSLFVLLSFCFLSWEIPSLNSILSYHTFVCSSIHFCNFLKYFYKTKAHQKVCYVLIFKADSSCSSYLFPIILWICRDLSVIVLCCKSVIVFFLVLFVVLILYTLNRIYIIPCSI